MSFFKWSMLLGSCLLMIGFFYTLPITFHNPSLENIGISAAMLLLIAWGLKVFFFPKKRQPVADASGMMPVQEDEQ